MKFIDFVKKQEKYEKLRASQIELQNADAQIKSLKRRKDEMSSEIQRIKSTLKVNFPDSLENLKASYVLVQNKFKKYEIDIAEDEKSLISMKFDAEKKKTEYEKFIEAEKNDSTLAAELKNLRDELCSKLFVKKEGWESEEQMNEILIKKAQEVLSDLDKEATTMSKKYKEEESRFLEAMKDCTKQMTILQVFFLKKNRKSYLKNIFFLVQS